MTGINFPDELSDLDGPEEHRAQYIQGLLDIAGEDARHVMLYVTVSVSVIALALTQLPLGRLLDLPLVIRLVLLAGLALMGAGAMSFLRYVRAIHIARMGIARCLASCDARHARQLWAGSGGIWQTRGHFFQWGMWLSGLGGGSVVVSIGYLLLSG